MKNQKPSKWAYLFSNAEEDPESLSTKNTLKNSGKWDFLKGLSPDQNWGNFLPGGEQKEVLKSFQHEITSCFHGRTMTNSNQNAQADAAFYRAWWKELKDPVCENCSCRLEKYSATHFAHILGKRWKHIRHDRRNFALLCGPCHHLLDFGTMSQRKAMKVFEKVEQIRTQLKLEYHDKGKTGERL